MLKYQRAIVHRVLKYLVKFKIVDLGDGIFRYFLDLITLGRNLEPKFDRDEATHFT